VPLKITEFMKLELRKLEAPKIEGMEEMALNIASVTQRFIAEMQKQEEELFTTALRTIAEPPIKGEITKGKITWRGIRLIRQQVGFDSYSWLEQRGKQISPKFHIEAKLPDLNVG
jgi:translation initiation factor 2B subunit (eIF-2B alpha/beta/delta family)